MRGYEFIDPEFLLCPDAGYESPCGVMSAQQARHGAAFKALRIPMRGYEPATSGKSKSDIYVTNPHAGL